MQLTTPDGTVVELVVLAREGATMQVETDAETWHGIHRAGWFHTAGTRTEQAFEPDQPVEIELALDPGAGDDTHTESWWARTATQAQPVPTELEGTLHEGVKFPDPPWLGGLEAAWRASSAAVSDEPLLDVMAALFLGQDWQLERPQPDSTVLRVAVPEDVGDFELWVRTVEDQHVCTVLSIIRVDTPPERVGDVLELAARMNGAVSVGSFEVDADSGLLSFKVGIDVEDDHLSSALARQMIGHAIVAAQRGRPLLESVLADRSDPRSAAARL